MNELEQTRIETVKRLLRWFSMLLKRGRVPELKGLAVRVFETGEE